MNITIHRIYLWAGALLLVTFLCSCTATASDVDESGLPPHLSVNLKLPEQLEADIPSIFSVEVTKSGKPLEDADQAEFVIWSEDDDSSTVTIHAEESSPGIYSVTYSISEEGLYVVQSRIRSANEQVMPAKRFALGTQAIERLAFLESAQHSGATLPADGGHH
ncbi:FixH family protein [Paenibacillus luteus]|uniref:FixH family protein n=1 Tax=Paenibacillus luteus TaxID=2545753 RepID=UPI00114315B5|nr:FixH family protein [Paenibacillus luteus]